MTFDKVSKKKATNCTPEAAKVQINVQVMTDPISNDKSYNAPDGYDATKDDDVHKCEDVKPFVSVTTQQTGPGRYKITATVNQGTFGLQSVNITADGTQVTDQAMSSPGSVTAEYTFPSSGSKNIVATVTDQGFYTASDTKTLSVVVVSPSALASLGNDRSWIFRNAITTAGRS
jgi:penicillin-binding protein 1A